MHAVHKWLPHSRALRMQDLILAGGAAGVAAAFNTPLAGIVFAVEELGRRLETRTSGGVGQHNHSVRSGGRRAA